jgi:hypothetical protein
MTDKTNAVEKIIMIPEKLREAYKYITNLFDPERLITTYRYIIIYDDGQTVKCVPIKVEKRKEY